VLVPWAKLVVLLALLAAPWPGLGRAYVRTFGAAATLLSPVVAPSGAKLSFAASPASDGHHEWFAMVSETDASSGALLHKGAVDLRRGGYLQMAFYLAAAVAFPLRRRGLFAASLGAGLLLFSMLGWLPVLMYLTKKQVIVLGAGSFSVLALVYRSLVTPPAMAFAVPGASWLVVRMLAGQTDLMRALPALAVRKPESEGAALKKGLILPLSTEQANEKPRP